MDTARGTQATQQSTGSKEWPWTPRFWDGMGMWGWFRLVVRESFCDCAEPDRHGAVDYRLQRDEFAVGARPVAPLRAQGCRHGDPRRSDLRDRPLAVGHHAAARALGAGRASYLFGHLRLFLPQAFSGLRLVLPAPAAGAAAGPAADGQHGGRLGPSSRGRIRAVQHGQPVALPDDCLSQPAAPGPGVFRPGKAVAAGAGGAGSGGWFGSSSASRCGGGSGSS